MSYAFAGDEGRLAHPSNVARVVEGYQDTPGSAGTVEAPPLSFSRRQ